MTLVVKSVAGEGLACLSDAQPSWIPADVIQRLPEQLPGYEYQLLTQAGPWQGDAALASVLAASGEEVSITAVTTKRPDGQKELDIALIQAAEALDPKRVCTLLTAGANPAYLEVTDSGGWGADVSRSALHAAIAAGVRGRAPTLPGEAWSAVVDALLVAQADVNARYKNISSRGSGPEETAFHMVLPLAVRELPVLVKFLGAGADTNARIERHMHGMRTDSLVVKYPLHDAVGAGAAEAVRAILDAGAAVDAPHTDRTDNERGWNQDMEETALHKACRLQEPDIALLLLERGANVNAVRRAIEQTPVKATARRKVTDPRAKGYTPEVHCEQIRETPLHIAVRAGHPAVVAALLQAGADATAERMRGAASTSVADLCGFNNELRALFGLEPVDAPPEPQPPRRWLPDFGGMFSRFRS